MNLSHTADDVVQQVLRADDLRLDAMVGGDVQTLERMLLDDLVYTHSGGRRDSKSQYLAGIASGKVKYAAATRTEVKAQFHGNTCILSGLLKLQASVDGKERVFATLFQSVWIRRGEDWAMAAWASTLPPARVEPA